MLRESQCRTAAWWRRVTARYRGAHYSLSVRVVFSSMDFRFGTLSCCCVDRESQPELRTHAPFLLLLHLYFFQLMMENIHSETYSLLLDTYIKVGRNRLRMSRGHRQGRRDT